MGVARNISWWLIGPVYAGLAAGLVLTAWGLVAAFRRNDRRGASVLIAVCGLVLVSFTGYVLWVAATTPQVIRHR